MTSGKRGLPFVVELSPFEESGFAELRHILMEMAGVDFLVKWTSDMNGFSENFRYFELC